MVAQASQQSPCSRGLLLWITIQWNEDQEDDCFKIRSVPPVDPEDTVAPFPSEIPPAAVDALLDLTRPLLPTPSHSYLSLPER